jgi:crossover junction endonuclease MUS81
MKDLIIIIDYREKWFINRVKRNEILENDVIYDVDTHAKIKVFFKISNLPVGDFIIKEKHGDKILLVIEKKTINDLCASITDGRFRQQKDRLLESINNPNKILYLIEGNVNNTKNNMVNGAIVNLIFKHHYKMLNTLTENESFDLIIMLYKKFVNNDFVNDNDNENAPMKLISKGDKINDNIFALQLSAISGVSYTTALLISKQYKTMSNLINEYEKCENQEREKMLCNIMLNEKRKIGNALSKKIYQALYIYV